MAYYQGLKYQEIADALDIPLGTVKSRLHAALVKLHEAWDDRVPAPSRGGRGRLTDGRTAVEENLLGHLLKANDPATQRAVEQRLASDPAAVRDLARLRAALAPLEADRAEADPPADLWVRTLAARGRAHRRHRGARPPRGGGPDRGRDPRAAAVAGRPPRRRRPDHPGPAGRARADCRRPGGGTWWPSSACPCRSWPWCCRPSCTSAEKSRQLACQNAMRQVLPGGRRVHGHERRASSRGCADGQPAARPRRRPEAGRVPARRTSGSPARRPRRTRPPRSPWRPTRTRSGSGTRRGQLRGLDRGPRQRPDADPGRRPGPAGGDGRARSTTAAGRTCCSPAATSGSARRPPSG